MPGFDGTGPMGQGPLTGGGRGNCGAVQPDYRPLRNRFYNRRFGGRGFQGGFGQGMRRGFNRGGWDMPYSSTPYMQEPEDELMMLKAEADDFKKMLEDINRRIADLEKSSE